VRSPRAKASKRDQSVERNKERKENKEKINK
jgi:hypothetical protein